MAEEVLLDWLEFLSPKPSEVVIVVGYKDSLPEVWEKLQESKTIDVLHGIEMGNRSPHQVCVEALYKLFDLASHEWIVTTNLDVLPFRNGNEGWLKKMHDVVLSDSNLLGATGSFRSMFNQRYNENFDQTASFSANFSLIKKNVWREIIESATQMARIDNDSANNKNLLSQNRFIIEHAVESYLFISGKKMLIKDESYDWSIFHVNVWNEPLRAIRLKYRKRKGIKKFLNRTQKISKMPWQIPGHKRYYGWPKEIWTTRLRVFLGKLRRDLLR